MTGFQNTPFKPATQSERFHPAPQTFAEVNLFSDSVEFKAAPEEWIAAQFWIRLEHMR